jgi:hypothetical protein
MAGTSSSRISTYSEMTQVVWKRAYCRIEEMGELILAPKETAVVSIERLETPMASASDLASTSTWRLCAALHGQGLQDGTQQCNALLSQLPRGAGSAGAFLRASSR